MSIIGAEDEDFENDLDPTVDDHCSHFTSIELVKLRPTHLLVFLQHVMLQFDCAPLLCYLHADLFRNLSPKETKKQFGEFYHTFLDKGAVLRVPVPQHMSNELDRTRPELISEENQKIFVSDVQNQVVTEVLRQLEDFRQKRMMGMTPNEHELIQVESHRVTERIPLEMKEKAVAETLLEKMSDIQPTIGTDEEKFSAIFGAVTSYMKHLGVKTKATDNKKSKGFFRKKIPGMKKSDDSTKSKQRRWIGGSNEIKPKENEGDKDKGALERKNQSSLPALSRNVAPEPAPPAFRKPAVSGSIQGSDGTEGPMVSISVTPSPDSSYTDSVVPSSRSDHQFVSEGGDVSPAGTSGVPIWEPPPTSDIPPEENQDRDRLAGRLARSESLCVERRRSQRGGSTRGKQSRSRSDVDLPAASAAAHPPSPSQQHPPLDGGAAASDVGALGPNFAGPAPPQEEMEPRLLELEQDPPNWREQASSENLNQLSKKEIKRQEVINELFVTEHAHTRMLSVLQTVFYRPLERRQLMSTNELEATFPNLEEIIEMHYTFYENLKKLRQEDGFIVKAIGATLLNRFCGAEGDWFQKLTARFCSHQSYALDQIKSRQRRDARFTAFIQEAESKPQCRRLQLKDIIPTEMQRLTKYPLLLENIAKSTSDTAEKDSIQQAAECCRKILNHVNEAVKEMENLLMLKDYQRRLDTSGLKPSNELLQEYKNIDLTQRKMIYEGPVTWKVTKEKFIDVQCVLLVDLLVLLQRQDDKMLLKCQSKNTSGVSEGKQMLSPIIKLPSVFLREVATDPKAFYVIFTWDSGAQIYELVAHSVVERKNWTELIKTTVDELKLCGSLKRTGSVAPLGGLPPCSPTNLHPSLSLSENGSTPRSNSSDKYSLSDEKGGDSRHSLMDCLSANGFDLIAHSNTPQEKVGNGALDQVVTLKRLLVGSISVSEVPQADGEIGGAVPSKRDPEMCPTSAEGGVLDGRTEGEGEEDGGERGVEDDGISAPVVLSQDRMEQVQKLLQGLEQHLKQLQNVEEEHHRLQEILCKFSISGSNFP